MFIKKKSILRVCCLVLVSSWLSGCYSSAANVFNPFAGTEDYEQPGVRSNDVVLEGGSGQKVDEARHALEVLGSQQRTAEPQPVNPVIKPAEVRLMWVPDHINKYGDLIPSHYYYLLVLRDRWATQDAFELEKQYGEGDGGASSTPWVYTGAVK